MADDPRRIREGGSPAARAVPGRRHLHVRVRPRAVASRDHERAGAHILSQPPARGDALLSAAGSADEHGVRVVRPRRLRPRPLEQPRLRQERDHGPRHSARLLLPHADALRLGSGLLRRRASRKGRAGVAPVPALEAAPAGRDRVAAPRCLRRELPPCGGSHREVLSPRCPRRPSARGCGALPRGGAQAGGLLPLPRAPRALQAGGPGGGGVHSARPAAEGGGRRPSGRGAPAECLFGRRIPR